MLLAKEDLGRNFRGTRPNRFKMDLARENLEENPQNLLLSWPVEGAYAHFQTKPNRVSLGGSEIERRSIIAACKKRSSSLYRSHPKAEF